MDEPTDVRLGVVRGIQYGQIAAPDDFAGRVGELGAGLVRVFLYWSQLEPRPGAYDWSAVDAVLEQFAGSDVELWFMVAAASPWGSSRATDLLPSSPPTRPEAYARMVRALVEHCRGRVAYWQCENEPCLPLFWVGSAAEYAEHLERFHAAVRAADPNAAVVLGGLPPGVFPRDAEGVGADEGERAFFLEVMRRVPEAYDIVDLHVYGDPYVIPAAVADIHTALRESAGSRPRGDEPGDDDGDKPVFMGEYNGPVPFDFPEVFGSLREVFAAGATDPFERVTVEGMRTGAPMSPAPAREAMRRLYDRMPELPEHLQMFMDDCPPELDALRDRLNAREIVVRNLLALAAGIRRTACWQLAPESPEPPRFEERFEFLQLMFSKIMLFAYADDKAAPIRTPSAESFAGLASRLVGARAAHRIDVPERPDAYVFEVTRAGRPPLYVGWLRTTEAAPGTAPETAPEIASAGPEAVTCKGIRLELSADPAYVEA